MFRVTGKVSRFLAICSAFSAIVFVSPALSATTVDTPCGKISVEDHCVTMPDVKSITIQPAVLEPGKPVTITCAYVGGAHQVIDHPDSAQDKAWHSYGMQFPLEIRAEGVKVFGKYIAAPSPGAVYQVQTPWTPAELPEGKPMNFECVIDPSKQLHYSSKQASVNVPTKPKPRVNIKDQPAPTAKPIPGGPKLPASNMPPATLPDLAISAVTYQIFPCSIEGKYSRLEIHATVKNQGKGPASAPGGWGIAVTAYPNVFLTVPAQYSVKPMVYGPMTLKEGESFDVKLDLTVGPAKNNQGYGAVVQVDPANSVAESDENNNSIIGVNVPALKDYCTAQ
jgi:hypothetical protein